MKLDLLSLIIGLMLIPVIFLVRRSSLTQKKIFRLLLIITSILALTGLITTLFVEDKPNFFLFLICPIYSLILHKILHYWFKKFLHREPIDTTFLWFPKTNVGWDRAFNISFLILSISIPLFLLAIFGGK